MRNKRILIISYYSIPFNTPRSIQLFGLSKALEEEGYELEIVTANFRKYDKSLKYYADKIQYFIRVCDFHEIIILKKILNKINRVMQKIIYYDNSIIWIVFSFIRCLFIKKPDIIISFSYPFDSHLVALPLKYIWKARWVSFFSDPYVQGGDHACINANLPLLRKKVYEISDKIIFPCYQTAVKDLKITNTLWDKVHIIPHNIAANSFNLKLNNDKTIKFNQDNYLHIGHFGSFYSSYRSPEQIIFAIRKANLPIKLHFYGERLTQFNDDFIVWNNPLDYIDSLYEMIKMDVLLLIDMNSSNAANYFPSKIMDYLWARKPILSQCVEGSFAYDFIKNGGGVIISPNDEITAIKTISQLYYDKLNGKISNFRTSSELLKEYEPYAIIKNYISLF